MKSRSTEPALSCRFDVDLDWFTAITMLLRLTRPRILVIVFVLTLLFLGIYLFYKQIKSIPLHHHYNPALHYTPRIVHPLVVRLTNPGIGELTAPTIFHELTDAPSLNSWTTLPLLPNAASPKSLSPHVFSTSSVSSRERRALIRRFSPLALLGPAARHLVEVKFIVGY